MYTTLVREPSHLRQTLYFKSNIKVLINCNNSQLHNRKIELLETNPVKSFIWYKDLSCANKWTSYFLV